MVRIPRVGEAYTHQQYMLFVDRDRRSYGAFAVVVCPIDTFSPLLVHQNSNSVFVLEFSSSHEYVCPCCVSQISALLALHVSLINIASNLYPSTSWVNSSIRSLEFSDLTFFCSTMKVMYFSLRVSLVVLFASVLLLLAPLLSLSASFASFCCHLHMLLCCCSFRFLLSSLHVPSPLFRIQIGTSPST